MKLKLKADYGDWWRWKDGEYVSWVKYPLINVKGVDVWYPHLKPWLREILK